MQQVIVKHEGSMFKLHTDERTGRSFWCCIKGRNPGSIQGRGIGVSVPTNLFPTLSVAAIEQGYTREQLASFSKKTVKDEKKAKSKIAKARRKTVKREGISIKVTVALPDLII